MQEILVFVLEHCPYCKQLKRILADWKDRPELEGVQFRFVDEEKNPELVKQYSYYYVPTLFADGRKLYEAQPSHSEPVMRELLEQQLIGWIRDHRAEEKPR